MCNASICMKFGSSESESNPTEGRYKMGSFILSHNKKKGGNLNEI